MVWCTEISSSDTFWPFPTCLKMTILWKIGKISIWQSLQQGVPQYTFFWIELRSLNQPCLWVRGGHKKIFSHFQAWSPRVAKCRQGFPRSQGDPRVGWDELEPNRSYLSHFPTRYSKSGHFPIEIPIKNENLSLNAILLSITLKIFLWPPLTQRHGWLRERSSIQKNVYCGTPYSLV